MFQKSADLLLSSSSRMIYMNLQEFCPRILSGCVTGTDSAVIDEIIETPGNFNVNVHNSDYPGGAVRGQLAMP